MGRGRRSLRENVTNCHHYFCPTQGRRGEEIGKLFFCIFIVFLLLYFWSCEIFPVEESQRHQAAKPEISSPINGALR